MHVLEFHRTLQVTDPETVPVLIIGQLHHLTGLPFERIRKKLQKRVTEETYATVVAALKPAPTDARSLYLDHAKVCALPLKASRHNTNSRAHAITKLIQTNTAGISESIVIVCEKPDLLASSCAVARAYPLYNRKTGKSEDTDPPPTVHVEFVLVGDDTELVEEDLQVLRHLSTGILMAASIVDKPCNEMNVSGFLHEVNKVGDKLKITPKIIRGLELKEKGFGGIYGVGKAAADPPALAVLSYEPQGATETIAWVGKGIVFDTGGLSIKGKTAMPGMKRDCGGAAAILGGFYAAVKSGFRQNLHAVFCLAENSVGPDATRPDDIHQLYSGRTVEINNTDAEGRLVLADGVAYADRDLKAEIILDMATLTGAQGIATGKYHGAIMTNSGTWEQKGLELGRRTGDLLSPVPYTPELHFSEFVSVVADMKNSVMDRSNAQVSCAGLFIGAHLGFDYPGSWIHVDMASPVHNGERATGYGVALLNGLFGEYSKSTLLQDVAHNPDQLRNSTAVSTANCAEPPAKKAKN